MLRIIKQNSLLILVGMLQMFNQLLINGSHLWYPITRFLEWPIKYVNVRIAPLITLDFSGCDIISRGQQKPLSIDALTKV